MSPAKNNIFLTNHNHIQPIYSIEQIIEYIGQLMFLKSMTINLRGY